VFRSARGQTKAQNGKFTRVLSQRQSQKQHQQQQKLQQQRVVGLWLLFVFWVLF